jgi:hypothetical protein
MQSYQGLVLSTPMGAVRLSNQAARSPVSVPCQYNRRVTRQLCQIVGAGPNTLQVPYSIDPDSLFSQQHSGGPKDQNKTVVNTLSVQLWYALVELKEL